MAGMVSRHEQAFVHAHTRTLPSLSRSLSHSSRTPTPRVVSGSRWNRHWCCVVCQGKAGWIRDALIEADQVDPNVWFVDDWYANANATCTCACNVQHATCNVRAAASRLRLRARGCVCRAVAVYMKYDGAMDGKG